jgi:hypothetical protein
LADLLQVKDSADRGGMILLGRTLLAERSEARSDDRGDPL